MLPRYPNVAELSKLTEVKGFQFIGRNFREDLVYSDHSGDSVSSVGDINGDGFDDIIIGAPGATPSSGNAGAGQSYVFFGNASLSQNTFRLLNLDGHNGFILSGINTGDNSGWSVSGAGDVNGDGFDDIIIGAPGAVNNAGQSYVVFGKNSNWSKTLPLSNLDGNNGFMVNGIGQGNNDGDQSGFSVSTAGDVNGDGFDDIIIGAPYATNNYAGQSYVIFGKNSAWNKTLPLSSLDGSNGFMLTGISAGDGSGGSVSGAGDVNGDGISDIIIGAPHANNNAGQSYVIFGKNSAWNKTFSLSSLDGSNGFTLNGISAEVNTGGDFSGSSVSGAGDMNGDGVADLLIGAPSASPNGNSHAGQSYVVFGSGGPWNEMLSLSSLDGGNGFTLNGIALLDQSGYSVREAGDMNGDGVSDIIIGALAADVNAAGQAYVIFGRRGAWNQTFSLSNLDGGNGFILNGVATGDNTGYSVSAAGDINGDGVSDLVVGAPYASLYANAASGCTYIITNATNFHPWFVNTTQLTIDQGQFQLFSTENIRATDDWTADKNLQFIISKLQSGKFIASGVSTLTFSQGDVMGEKVIFIHDGSDNVPSFDVSVNDGTLTTGPVPATIHFTPNPKNDTTRNAAIAGTLGGLAGVVIFGTLFLRYRANKQLEETISQLGSEKGGSSSNFRRTVLLPIAKAIFNHIKITGFMNYINEATTRAYVNAIEAVVEELQKQGVDLDLEKMSPEHQQSLFNEVSKQIRLHTLPKRDGCATAATTFCRFFKAEIAPIEIEDKANAIAVAVQKELSVRVPLLDHDSQQDGVEFSQEKPGKGTIVTQTESAQTSPAFVASYANHLPYSSKTPSSTEDDGETEKFITALKLSSREKQKNDLPGDNPQTRLIM